MKMKKIKKWKWNKKKYTYIKGEFAHTNHRVKRIIDILACFAILYIFNIHIIIVIVGIYGAKEK